MKRSKMLVFSVLLIAVLLVLAACGSGGGQSSGPPSSGGSSNSDSTGSSSGGSPSGGSAPGNSSSDTDSGKQPDLPKTITIATHAVGGAYHAVGSGLAKLITDHTPIRAIVQPGAGPNAWMGDLDAGRVNFGLMQAADAGWGYTGGPGYDKPAKNLRLVLAGNMVFNTGWTVREDSGITSIKQLKGLAVASDYGGNVSLRKLAEAEFKAAGLTWDDVKQVPTPNSSSGLKLLQVGRVKAVMAAGPTTPYTIQADSNMKLKILPFGDLQPEDLANGVPEEMQAILDEVIPGVTLKVAPKGLGILREDTVMMTYPITMDASVQTSPDTVYTVLKAIWNHYKEIADVHPWLKGWDSKNFLMPHPPAPYHEGAIRFYKEMGLWNDQLQAEQDKLLAKSK